MAKRSKKRKSKLRKKTKSRVRKKTKSRLRKKIKKIKISKNKETGELVYKTKNEWIKKALIGKSEYEKKYSKSIKDNENFGKKKAKELTG